MLDTQEFGDFLQSMGLRDFVGVPCSYLAPLINYAINEGRFVMSNNEGDAVAIASGISLCNGSLTQSLNECGNSASVTDSKSAPSPHFAQHSNLTQDSALHIQKECQDSRADSSITESSKKYSRSAEFFDKADSSAEVSLRDFSGFGAKGEGSLLGANDRALSEQSAKSTKETTRFGYGVVLMQNSGLSNALSPLTSLNYTFKIPILGFVSLRGERDEKGCNTDEPQHELLGVITDKILETCQIQYAFLDSSMESAKAQVERALQVLGRGESFFFIIKDKTFSKVLLSDNSRILDSATASLQVGVASAAIQNLNMAENVDCHENPAESLAMTENVFQADSSDSQHSMPQDVSGRICEEKSVFSSEPTRSYLDGSAEVGERRIADFNRKANAQKALPLPTRLQALEILHSLALDSKALLLATTGKCGRELYEIQDSPNQLYMVGSMGCVSSLSLGIALKSPQKVIAIDGDSALLMRLGALSTNAYYARNLSNFCHILLDNESHDSTGGQFNLSPFVDFASVARHCGYVNVYVARNLKEFEMYVRLFLENSKQDSTNLGAYFIYLKIAKGSKDNLGRPKITPQAVAKRLQAYMQEHSCMDK